MREITCDESGYEGEKLIDTTTRVFAHSCLSLSEPAAADLLNELRARVRSPATQYKSNHLLREKHRPVLEWFLSDQSPVYGNGRVFLVDKAHFLVTRLAELLDLDPAAVDPSPYVLAAANDMLRGKDRPGVVDEFFRVSGLAEGRERAELFRAWLLADPVVNSVLDPLVPALVAAVRPTSVPTPAASRTSTPPPGAGRTSTPPPEADRTSIPASGAGRTGTSPPGVGRTNVPPPPGVGWEDVTPRPHTDGWDEPVTVVHDRQVMLPERRIARVRELSGGRLAAVVFQDAASHPRIQIADILAGTIRQITERELTGRGDPVLTALARPYVDPAPITPPHWMKPA